MCEQTEVKYLEGDVVWVKLGPCWWPGEVQDMDKLAPDLTAGFKKPPLAVIKFFQEDSYEFVKNLNNIYKYNCRKKNEFIKKGLDMYRSKMNDENNFMKKFPKDVTIAETKTDGDPNIVNSELFAPEQKPNYAQLFGTPSPKKSPKNMRGRPSLNNTPKSAQKSSNASRCDRIEITHPRFIGERSDYGVTILQQTPPSSESNKASEYTCHICGYRATRLNVIMLHTKSHSNQNNNSYISPKGKKNKVTVKKDRKSTKKTFAQTSSIDEDLALIRQGFQLSETSETESESDVDIKTVKSTPKRKRPTKGPTTKKTKIDRSSVICNNLLADWGDSDDDAEAGTSTTNLPRDESSISEDNNDKLDEVKPTDTKIVDSKDAKAETQENGKVSCFDFKDDEEEDESLLEKSPGRKIPRVIPQKRKSLETSDSERRTDSEPETITKVKDARSKKSNSAKSKIKPDKEDLILEDAIKNILEETAVPEVPTIEHMKAAKNFQERQPIKSPDKNSDENIDKTNGVLKNNEKTIESVTEAITDYHPKKRFVRNFEDFEMFHNEQKIAEENKQSSSSNLEVSKLKTQLMNKLTTEFSKEETSQEEQSLDKLEVESKSDSDIEKIAEDEMILQETNRVIEDLTDPIPELREEMNITPLIKEMQEQVKKQIAKEHKKHKVSQEKKESLETLMEENDIKISENLQESSQKIDEEKPDEKHLDVEIKESEDKNESKPEISDSNIDEKNEDIQEECIESKENVEEIQSEILEKNDDITNVEEKSSEEPIPVVQDMTELASDMSSKPEESDPVPVQENIINQETEELTKISSDDKQADVTDKDESQISPNDTSGSQSDTIQTDDVKPSKIVMDISDICIDNTDNLSGLTTLAAVSDFVFESANQTPKESEKVIDPVFEKSDIISEDVENEQVAVVEEIPQEKVETVKEHRKQDEIRLPPKKVATLATFSLDFSDSNDSISNKKDVTEEKKDEQESLKENKKITDIIEETNDLMKTSEGSMDMQQLSLLAQTDDGMVELQDYSFQDEKVIEEKTVTNIKQSAFELLQHTLESEMAKLTDTHPGTEEVIQEQMQNTSSSKLLEILTEPKPVSPSKKMIIQQKTIPGTNTSSALQMVITGDKTLPRKFDVKTQKLVIKSATPSKPLEKPSKPIRILSEKIIKPERVIIKPDADSSESVSVKKVTSKRTFLDVEDIDTFIISKAAKKSHTPTDAEIQDILIPPKVETTRQVKGPGRLSRNKPRIIEQTIIKAADVPSPVDPTPIPTIDDSMFDINSMPIVLSDQILTPESLENMPVVMSEQLISVTVAGSSNATVLTTEKPQTQTIPVKRGGTLQQIKLLNKAPKVNTSQSEVTPKAGQTLVKNIMPKGLGKNQKVYQSSTKLLKTNPAVITQPGKPGKFIILPTSTTSTSSGSKYTVGKRLAVKSTTPISSASPTTSKTKIISGLPNEPTGNKIMIVTNNQGQQSRVLLTPAHQKMLAGKMSGTKITKAQTSQVKGNLIQPKSIFTSKGMLPYPVNSGLVVSSQKTPQIVSQTIMTSKGQIITSASGQTLVTSEGQILTPLTPQQLKNMKTDTPKGVRKIQSSGSRLILPEKSIDSPTKGKLVMGGKTKTILIKGSQGQTLKKYSSATPESKNLYLYGQKEMVSLTNQQLQQATTSGKQVIVTSKGQVLKSDSKSLITSKQPTEKVNIQRVHKTPTRTMQKNTKTQMLVSAAGSSQSLVKSTSAINVPPLAPITASQTKKTENIVQTIEQPQIKTQSIIKETKDKLEVPQTEQKHLVIQDALGNQTTVAEGQILALPSETVDGQPQSYMLVTVDESGNLVPISNETLMSLDPSLALGDTSNVMIQIDGQSNIQQTTEAQTSTEEKLETITTSTTTTEVPMETQVISTDITNTATEQQVVSIDGQQVILDQSGQITEQQIIPDGQQMIVTTGGEQETCLDETYIVPEGSVDTQTVACNINTSDSSQHLIITGDPESTQKFLASLSEGNTDLSSLLTGAEGPVIINTDGQQILLNTDSENPILLMQTSTEEDINQSTMFVNQQAMKNQDILAAALADTDVFQQDSTNDKLNTTQELTKVVSTSQSQLSPNSSLYPMNVGNVLETSLINSPIMTPLELPANKKVKQDLDTTLMPQVPSSLELPITITDPSISQTVNQHVMLGNELQSNLDLPISISDTITSIRSTEINSPSFVYSLPTLEDNSEMEIKTSLSETSSSPIPVPSYSTSLTGPMSMPLLTEEPEITQTSTETVTEEITESTLQTEIDTHDTMALIQDQVTMVTETEQLEHEQETVITEPEPENQKPEIVVEQTEKEEISVLPENEQITQETEEVNKLSETVLSEPDMVTSKPESESIGSDIESKLSNENFTTIQTESDADIAQKMTNELEIEIEEELGLQSSDICDSLSEPPPGMFDNTACLVDETYLSSKEVHPRDIPLPPGPPLPLETPPLPTDTPLLNEVPLPENPPLPLEPPPPIPENPPLPPEIPLPADIPLPPDDPIPEDIPLPPEPPLSNDENLTESATSENCNNTHSIDNVNVDYQEVNQEIPASDLSNSEMNSPRLDIDETSCEIPIQPDIVTSLSEPNMATHFDLECDSRKRDCDDIIDEAGDVKRTKLACD